MPDIHIVVRNKEAQLHEKAVIVCGNSDYTVHFDFDSEWNAYDGRTLCVKFCKRGKTEVYEMFFVGNSVEIPPVYDVEWVEIGVYAGDIHTTTGARIACVPCITDGNPVHSAPPHDVYNQIMEYLAQIAQGSGGLPAEAVSMIAVGDVAPESLKAESLTSDPPETKWDYWQETGHDEKTSAVFTAGVLSDCLLLVCVMHRGEIEIDGDGWDKIITSKAAKDQYGKPCQKITVYAKRVYGGMHTVRITQNTSAVMSLKTIFLYGAQAVTAVGDDLLASYPYTPPEASGKRRLYLLSSVYNYKSSDPYAITADHGDLDLRRADETLFSAFYDYQPEKRITPVFGYSGQDYDADSINALTLDIEEV